MQRSNQDGIVVSDLVGRCSLRLLSELLREIDRLAQYLY